LRIEGLRDWADGRGQEKLKGKARTQELSWNVGKRGKPSDS